MHCEDLTVQMTRKGAEGNQWQQRCNDTEQQLREMERKFDEAEDKIDDMRREMADAVKDTNEKETMTDVGAEFFNKPQITSNHQQTSNKSIDSQSQG